jgi:hypothetical protein
MASGRNQPRSPEQRRSRIALYWAVVVLALVGGYFVFVSVNPSYLTTNHAVGRRPTSSASGTSSSANRMASPSAKPMPATSSSTTPKGAPTRPASCWHRPQPGTAPFDGDLGCETQCPKGHGTGELCGYAVYVSVTLKPGGKLTTHITQPAGWHLKIGLATGGYEEPTGIPYVAVTRPDNGPGGTIALDSFNSYFGDGSTLVWQPTGVYPFWLDQNITNLVVIYVYKSGSTSGPPIPGSAELRSAAENGTAYAAGAK